MPSSTSAIRAGRAFVELFADDSKLMRGLRRAQAKLQAFGSDIRRYGLNLAGAVSAITAPLGMLTVKAASDAQESLNRFQAVFKDQAKAAGQFANALATAVGRSKIDLYDALATFQSFFVGLGFGGEKARGLSQQLQSLALDFASFHNLSDAEAIERFIAALSGSSEVLDKFGVNIKQAALQQQLLSMGISKSWSEVTEQEKALGRLNIIMRAMGEQGAVGDAVKTAGSFANQLKRLKGYLRDVSVAIGSALLPVLTPLVAQVAQGVKWLGQWIAAHQALVATLFKVAAGVAALGAVLVVLGTSISVLGAILGGLLSVLGTVTGAIATVGTVIAGLISPIGLAVAAVAAMGTYLIYASGMGGKALAWLGERFAVLKDDALAAYRGIADALAAGDLALAVRVLWQSVQLVWAQGIYALKRTWLGFGGFFLKVGSDAWHGLLAVAERAWHGLEVGWIETTGFFARAWLGFTSFFARTWERIKAGASKAWNWIQSLFDESVDLEVSNRLVDQATQKALAGIEDDRQRQLAQQAYQQKWRRERAEQTHRGTLGVIGRESLDQQDQLEKERAARLAEHEADLARARRAWREAMEAARQKREATEAQAGPEGLEDPNAIIAKARDALAGLGDIGDLVRQQAEKISVVGTFNTAALAGIGAGDAADRTARYTEQTAKHTRQLLEEVREGGLTF